MLADFNFAWPQAEVAVMGPEGAVNIIFRRDIAKSPTLVRRRRRSFTAAAGLGGGPWNVDSMWTQT